MILSTINPCQKMKNIRILLYSVGILLWLIRCNEKPREEHKKEKTTKFCLDENMKVITTFDKPIIQQAKEGIHLTGKVETNPDNVVHFVSLVGGIISNVYFSLGDKVTKGQVLAELRSTELSNLQTELKNLESQIVVSEKKLQVAQSMFNDGITSQKELLEAQSELDILKSQKQKIESNLNLFSASKEKGVFLIKAPSNGIITSKSISVGTQIHENSEPLFTISNLNEVWVLVNIYASNVQNIKEGMEVNIKTIAYPGEIFKGVIQSISNVYDEEEKVLKARVVLPNPELKLKPGMLVDAIVIKKGNQNVISVPTDAIVFDNNQYYVVVYKSDCEIEVRKVEILSKNNGTTYLSAGINENESIITKNQLIIYEHINHFQNQ